MMLDIIDFFGGYLGYYANYITYYIYSTLDILWSPFASMLNAGFGLISGFFDLILTLFAWSNETFSYFMVALVLIFIIGILVKLLLWIKSLIPFV